MSQDSRMRLREIPIIVCTVFFCLTFSSCQQLPQLHLPQSQPQIVFDTGPIADSVLSTPVRVSRSPEETGCGFVHMVGTNNANFADGPFDYVETHKRAPLDQPIAGKWTINNERNPAFSPEQEASYFAAARQRGLAWAFWRASMDESDMVRTLSYFRDIAQGGTQPVGCYPPPEDDEAWRPGPVKTCTMREALEDAKLKVGDRRPFFPTNGTSDQKFQAMFETLELLAAEMRKAGHCAGRSRDSVFVRAQGGLWEEMHAVAETDGGYTGHAMSWLHLDLRSQRQAAKSGARRA